MNIPALEKRPITASRWLMSVLFGVDPYRTRISGGGGWA